MKKNDKTIFGPKRIFLSVARVSFKIFHSAYGDKLIFFNVFSPVESNVFVAVLVPVFIVILIAIGVAGFIFYRFVPLSKKL